jgi:hypothetical protein
MSSKQMYLQKNVVQSNVFQEKYLQTNFVQAKVLPSTKHMSSWQMCPGKCRPCKVMEPLTWPHRSRVQHCHTELLGCPTNHLWPEISISKHLLTTHENVKFDWFTLKSKSKWFTKLHLRSLDLVDSLSLNYISNLLHVILGHLFKSY